MFAKIRPRRSTTAEWELVNPILREGEWGLEVPDDGVGKGASKLKVGDGTTQWSDLPYAFNPEAADSIYGGSVDVSHDIWLRTGTADEWETEDPLLGPGELVFDITNYKLKIGDGEHTFTNLDYVGEDTMKDKDYDFGDIDDEDE